MSISISGASPLSSSPITAATEHKGTGKGQGADKAQDAVQNQSSEQIANQTSSTSSNGTTTTVITYADGTTSTTTQQGTAPTQAASSSPQAQAGQNQQAPGTAGGLLDPSNVGQNAALLAAQERARG